MLLLCKMRKGLVELTFLDDVVKIFHVLHCLAARPLRIWAETADLLDLLTEAAQSALIPG